MSDRQFFKKLIDRTRENERRVKHLAVTSQRAEIAGAFPRAAFADLPSAGKVGRVFMCTDCRKSGEGAGAGTGTPVWDDGSDWLNFFDNGVASA